MSGESDKICKDSASTKSNDDGICDVNDMLQNMSTGDNEHNGISVCENCGKEGSSDNMNTCNKCKQVRYCNAVCKKVHKKKHKKDCEEYVKLAAEKHDEEIRRAAEKHDIELFKEPPSQHGDCPICFLQIPNLNNGWRYQSCCGKVVCCGCCWAPLYDNQGNLVKKVCPFCRVPKPTSEEEANEREKKLIEKDNAIAIYNLGNDYFIEMGQTGYPQDYVKALELFHRAGALGHAMAYSNIGYAHTYGKGVKVDMKKAIHYYEISAMMGNERARHNLGIDEEDSGNIDRAIKHYMIAAGSGCPESLKKIQQFYLKGLATKDDYMKALQLYQVYLGEIKSAQRDKAAADDEECRYY